MLTLEQLEPMPPDTIFATGSHRGGQWIAQRGDIADWAIYTGPAKWSITKIAEQGDKIFDKRTIRSLVPCDDAAMNKYRW